MPVSAATPTRRRRPWSRWLRSVEDEARHLHEVEVEGESPATPAITIAEVILFVAPILGLILGLSFLGYYVLS